MAQNLHSQRKDYSIIPDFPVSLPATISSIQIQQKQKNRCSLFVNNTFVIGFDQHILTETPLKKGDSLTKQLWETIWICEQKRFVFHWMLSRLELRSHSFFELKQKCILKGFPQEWIQFALEKIESLNLINEEEFARTFAQSRQKYKKWGFLRIQNELIKKGLPSSIVQKITQELKENNPQLEKELIKDLIQKKLKSLVRETDIQKKQQKLIRFLISRGYSYSIISNVIKEERIFV